MFRPRVIPVVLIGAHGHAVKSIRFKSFIDLGDAINTVSLFNSFKVDELVILDIQATRRGRTFSPQLMADLASEARVPLTVGGGIASLPDVRRLLLAGAEKVVLSSSALARPEFVREASEEFGSSSITVCLDCHRDWLGRSRVISRGSRISAPSTPAAAAQLIEEMGAGEVVVQSVDRDGTMAGYDLLLVNQVADAVGVPVIALGGAGSFEHVIQAHQQTFASAFASGSLFCFQDESRGVLINYPDPETLATLVNAP